MQYLSILTRALAISWHHRYLWLLALFAGEVTTVSFGLGSGPHVTSFDSGRPRYSFGLETGQAGWNQFSTWAGGHAGLLLAAGIALAVLWFVLLLVTAIANGALVKGGAAHDADTPFGLRQAWTEGTRTFWPVLRLKVFALVVGLSGFVVIGGLALITAVLAMSGAAAGAIATGALALLLLITAIPSYILFAVAILLGVRAIVLDGRGASDGFRAALDLIWRRRGRIALFWLLVCIAGIVASFVATLVVVIIAIPLVATTAAAYFAGGWLPAAAIGLALGSIFLVAVAALMGGIHAFTSTCWTLAYPRFDLEPEPATSAQPLPA